MARQEEHHELLMRKSVVPRMVYRTGGAVMARMLVVSCLALLALGVPGFGSVSGRGLALAQDRPYRVVFDLTSRDSLDQRAVMRWIKEVSASSPTAQLEGVMSGKGFELVIPE